MVNGTMSKEMTFPTFKKGIIKAWNEESGMHAEVQMFTDRNSLQHRTT